MNDDCETRFGPPERHPELLPALEAIAAKPNSFVIAATVASTHVTPEAAGEFERILCDFAEAAIHIQDVISGRMTVGREGDEVVFSTRDDSVLSAAIGLRRSADD